MSIKVLLVEDDLKIQEGICDYLTAKSEGTIEIYRALSVRRAEELVYENEFDLALLDINLPDGDGFSVCRLLRGKSDVPIVFLTARAREEDKLYGYEIGCDDYLVKPFSMPELYAKMHALLKRSKGIVRKPLIEVGNIKIDPFRMQAFAEEQEVALSPKMYLLLKYLCERPGAVVPREDLLVHIWGYDYEGSDRVVDNHIRKLRDALGSAGKQIRTVFTKGYRLEEQ